MSAPTVRSRSWVRTPGWWVLGVGVALGVIAVVVLVVTVGPGLLGTVNAPVHTTPLAKMEHFDRGTYAVYERTGTQTGGAGFTVTNDNATVLQPADVKITNSAGTVLNTSALPSGEAETLSRGRAIYTASVRFTAPASGEYFVVINAAPGTKVVISRDVGSLFRQAVPGILLGVTGVIALIVGTVLLVIEANRRRRARQGFVVPAGYYPDPYQPGSMRWWNGSHWT